MEARKDWLSSRLLALLPPSPFSSPGSCDWTVEGEEEARLSSLISFLAVDAVRLGERDSRAVTVSLSAVSSSSDECGMDGLRLRW